MHIRTVALRQERAQNRFVGEESGVHSKRLRRLLPEYSASSAPSTASGDEPEKKDAPDTPKDQGKDVSPGAGDRRGDGGNGNGTRGGLFDSEHFWRWFALIALVLVSAFLFLTLALGAIARRGPLASTGSKVDEARSDEISASATTRRAQASSEAIRAAAALASTLGAELGTSTATTAAEGTQIVHDFLNKVGFPLTEKGISRLASTLWKRFAVPKPPPLPAPVQPTQRFQTIKLTVVMRDQRPLVRVIRVPADDP